jgi:hypothetical protein
MCLMTLPTPLLNHNHHHHPIHHLLKTYSEVFQDPKTLPPQRTYDHAIPLIPRSTHINSKPFIADYTPVYDALPVTTDLEATATMPEAVIDRRLVKKGNSAIPQVKVKWTGLPTATTWEDYFVVKQRFPDAPA